MAEQQNGDRYPKIICEKCSVPMVVIGLGSATGRLKYHCSVCGSEQWGKNPAASVAAAALGALGGKARAAALTPEERSVSAKQAVDARWRKVKQSRNNLV